MLLAVAWVVAAALLWRTKVPGDLAHPRLDPSAYFSASELHRAARYSSVARQLFLLCAAAELLVLVGFTLLARRLARGFPKKESYFTVQRDAMDIDELKSPALYFGTTTGQLWMGRDGGEEWSCLFDSLPPIHCVKVAVV